jgi:nicotinamidase/pyrazinamidase
MNKPEIGLVIVDMQKDFVNPDGALYVPDAVGIKSEVLKLHDMFLSDKNPIVVTMDAHPTPEPGFPPHCMIGTKGMELYTNLSPDYTLEKDTFDVFSNPEAEKVFKQTGVKIFYVCGVATEYCVKYAVLGLLKRGYKVIVIEDAIRGITPEGTKKALDEMGIMGAILIPYFGGI